MVPEVSHGVPGFLSPDTAQVREEGAGARKGRHRGEGAWPTGCCHGRLSGRVGLQTQGEPNTCLRGSHPAELTQRWRQQHPALRRRPFENSQSIRQKVSQS